MAVSKKQFISGSLWKAFEQFGSKAITMIVSIVLARLLMPEDYGLLALTVVFTSLSEILIDGGLSTALIRKDKIEEGDYNAVFALSIVVAVVLYAVLFFAAPFVAAFYETDELIPVLRVMGLVFFVQALTVVRNGIVNRTMQFKLLFRCNIVSSVVSGSFGIAAALFGLGVWALVIQRLSQQILLTLLLLKKVKWQIAWRPQWSKVSEMAGFSMGVLASTLLSYISINAYNLVIGKRYSVADLGYYEKGCQLPMQFSQYTFGAMSVVLLPTLSQSQDDIERLKRITRKVVGMTAFLVLPLMLITFVCSRDLIVLLFTEKWLPALSVMHLMCVYYVFNPFFLIAVQVFYALGKSGLRVRLEALRAVLVILTASALFVFPSLTMNDFVFMGVGVCFFVALASFCYVRQMLGYGFGELAKDLIRPVLSTLCASMAVAVWGVLGPGTSAAVGLLAKSLIAVMSYCSTSFLVRDPNLKEIATLIRGKLGK